MLPLDDFPSFLRQGRDVGVSQVGVLFEELHPALEECAPSVGWPGQSQGRGGGWGVGEESTHLLTVSESPMTVSERFGRVIATVSKRTSATYCLSHHLTVTHT